MKQIINFKSWCWHCNNVITEGSLAFVYPRKDKNIYFHTDCFWPHRIRSLLGLVGIKTNV
jgi:hypothetical protein